VCIDDSGCSWVNTSRNRSDKFRCDEDFVESRRGALHDDSWHDFGRQGGLGESLLTELIICSERGNGLRNELWLGI